MSTKFDRCSHLVLEALETPHVTQKMAAHYCGVHPRTLQTWIAEGAEDSLNEIDSKKAIFYHSLKKAQVTPAIRCVKGIEMAGNEGQWQALAWLLERTRPKEFGRNAEDLRQAEEREKKADAFLNKVLEKIGQGGPDNHDGNKQTD